MEKLKLTWLKSYSAACLHLKSELKPFAIFWGYNRQTVLVKTKAAAGCEGPIFLPGKGPKERSSDGKAKCEISVQAGYNLSDLENSLFAFIHTDLKRNIIPQGAFEIVCLN